MRKDYFENCAKKIRNIPGDSGRKLCIWQRSTNVRNRVRVRMERKRALKCMEWWQGVSRAWMEAISVWCCVADIRHRWNATLDGDTLHGSITTKNIHSFTLFSVINSHIVIASSSAIRRRHDDVPFRMRPDKRDGNGDRENSLIKSEILLAIPSNRFNSNEEVNTNK